MTNLRLSEVWQAIDKVAEGSALREFFVRHYSGRSRVHISNFLLPPDICNSQDKSDIAKALQVISVPTIERSAAFSISVYSSEITRRWYDIDPDKPLDALVEVFMRDSQGVQRVVAFDMAGDVRVRIEGEPYVLEGVHDVQNTVPQAYARIRNAIPKWTYELEHLLLLAHTRK